MIINPRIFKSVAKAAVLALTLALFSVVSGPVAEAATTVYINDTDAPLAFVKANSTNLIGTGVAAGDVVLYKSVGVYGGVSIDAVITTISVSGSVSNYDNPGSASTAAGAANNWMINTVGGEARFRFEFFRSGSYTGANTGVPVVLQNVKITSIDLDCSSAAGSYQYTDATGFQKYAMMSPTNLAVQSMTSPNRVRFIANKTGSRSSVPEDQVMLKYDAVQKIEFSFGNVVAGSTNYFGLVFGGWPNGGMPVEYSNQYNTPPTSSDTSMNASGATLISLANFGNYADADNNPFFSVKLGAPSPNGTLEYFNGSAWVTASAGQVVTTADIEKGYLRFTPGAATTSTISFTVNDGLDDSVASYTLTITKVSNTQAITFNNPGTKGSGSGAFPSGATTNATGLTVILTSLTPGICTVSGLDITPVSAGTCVIVATQPGDATYGAAAPVTQEFQIVSGTAPTTPQTITFTRPDSMTVGSSAYTTNAISTSALTVTLFSTTPAICSVSGLTVTPISAGNCIVEATQQGNSTYLPATKVTLTIPVNAIAGGGTAPNVRTTGPKFTATDAVTLTGRLDSNGVNTNWQFCYKQTDSPQISNGVLGGSPTCITSAVLTDNGTQNREVTSDLSSLSNNNYYYQLVGWHTGNGKVYGGIWKFKPGSYPYIRTIDPTSVAETTATLNGYVQTKSDKEYLITICYSKAFTVATDYSGKLTNCDATRSTTPDKVKSGSFTSVSLSATGLVGGTHYYYQVIAKRNSSYSSSSTPIYGNIVQFDTSLPSPTVSTGSTTGFTAGGAVVNGTIFPNGNTVVPKFCITETYTAVTLTSSNCLTGALVTASPSSVSGTASVSIKYSVSGLTVGKVYYYQAYAGSTSIKGDIKSFTFGAPVATTQAATAVRITSGTSWQATLNGYVNPNGYTSENFFSYSDTNTVTSQGVLDSSTAVIASPDSFTARGSITYSLTGLTAGRTYYFQAIGKNSTGALYSYGEVLSFITASAPDVTTEDVLAFGVDTATVRGTMNANGSLSTGTFCISTSNATTAIDGVLDSCLFTLPTSPTTTSTSSATTGAAVGLSQATTYYYQAIAENSQGTSYGLIKSFSTLAGSPVATTVAATNVLSTTATLNGRVNSGGAATTVKFCYYTNSSVDGAGKINSCTLTPIVTTVAASAGLTAVTLNVDSLTVNTTYYFQVVASNTVAGSTTTIYGAVLSFKTGSPIVQTLAPTNVGATSATLNGTVKANGSNITSAKFCLATSSAVGSSGDLSTCVQNPNATPTTFNASITIANPESVTVTGLTTGTLYYFQVVATNAQSTTTYGSVLTFVAGAPIGVTTDATSVTSSSARLNGTVNRNNDSSATATFCLSDAEDVNIDQTLVTCTQSLDISSSLFTTLTSDDPVYGDVANLVAGNVYFFQITTNGANGTSIGEVLSFSTGYSVTFVANGGSGSMTAQTGTSPAALSTNAFTQSGYTFAGWSPSNSGAVAYADGATYDFAANLTLYAIWTASSTPAPTTPTPVKKKAKLTWGTPSPIKQGTPLSGTQLNAVTDVPSVCVYSPALGLVLPAGTYTLSVTCTPSDPNYEPISGTVILIVKGKVKPQIIWFNPTPITNPTPLSSTQLNALANVPGSYTYTPAAGTVLAPGTHPLHVHFKPSNTDDNEEMDEDVSIVVLEKNTKPAPAPVAPVNAPETKTAATPPTAIVLQTSGKLDTITVVKTNEPLGVLITATDWSLKLTSTTQFVQGTTQDTNDRVVIEKGNTVTTSGTGFKPFSQVDIWVYSTPTWLGAVITDQFGNFTTTVPMPAALPEGDHTFQAKGVTPDSTPRMADVPITLVTPVVKGKPGSLRFEVYFGMNSPIVTKAEIARVTKLVRAAQGKIASGAKITVEIDGWVQPNRNPGDIKYLSQHRADNVANELRALSLKGIYTKRYPGLEKDNIPSARHASVIIKWSKSK
ncbi:MAG: beta strand repeat-containing protein [Candidatus Planktophila sp.]